jgi:hypothetical protein
LIRGSHFFMALSVTYPPTLSNVHTVHVHVHTSLRE